MKFKRVLASVLSAAMILASVPGTGLSAYAAGNGELEIVDDAAEPDAAAELAVEEEIDEPDAADTESVVDAAEDVGNSITVDTVQVDDATLIANAAANTQQIPVRYTDDGGATWAFDDTAHWWHSRYDDWGQLTEGETITAKNDVFVSKFPWIGSGFGNSVVFQSVTYMGRNNTNNWIASYKLYAANTPDRTPTDEDFEVVAEGTLASPVANVEQAITLEEPVAATHFRLEARSMQGGGDGKCVTAQRIKAFRYNADPVKTPKLSVNFPTVGEVPGSVTGASDDEGYTVTGSVWSQNGQNLGENDVLGEGEATIVATLTAADGYLFVKNYKPTEMQFGDYTVPVTAEISEDHKTMTVTYLYSARDMYKVSADYAAGSDRSMGTVSVSAKSVEAGGSVTYTAVNSESLYAFQGWYSTEDASGEPVSVESTYTLENVSADTVLYAKFQKMTYYKQSEYWDAERAAGKLGTQTSEDIWHYQIKVDGLWSDIPSSAYYDTSDANNRWLQNGDGTSSDYYYAKISRDELTSTFSNDNSSQQAVGYAWKAMEAGYYYATLESNISAGHASEKMDLVVTHTASNMLQADGKTLLTQEVGRGENFVSRIARVEAGDYIRIGARKRNAWVQGFLPLIVPVTAKEYAAQYLADVAALLETRPYTAESVTAVTAAKENLEAAVASDSDIEEKLTELENAVNAAVMSVRYDAPAMGAEIEMTDDDRAFYANTDALSIDVAIKYDELPTTATNPIPLLTLSDGQGHYITAWYRLRDNATNNAYGAICFTGDGVAEGLYFSKGSWRIADTNWHKFTLGISSKNQILYIMKDGDTANALNWSFNAGSWVANGWNPFQKFLTSHEWSVEEILVGKKATNGTYNDVKSGVGGIVDAPTSGIQLKYIEVSDRTYQNVTDMDTRSNSKKDQTVEAELQGLINIADGLQEDGYTSESWQTFNTALSTARTAMASGKDWGRCDAIDSLKAAIEGLERVFHVSATATEGGSVSPETSVVTPGDTVTLTATANEGYEFAYWVDKNGNKVLSKEAGLTLTVYTDMELEAVFTATVENVTVVFKTASLFSDQVVDTQTVAAGSKVTVPGTSIAYAGYTFEGWTADNGATVVAPGEEVTADANVTYIAVYSSVEGYTITVANGQITNEPASISENRYAKDTLITVEANEPETGKYFVGWYVGEMLISANATYSFWVKTDMNLEARYADSEAAAVPTLSFPVQTRERTPEGKDKLRMGIYWDTVEGCTIVSEGILRTYEAGKVNALTVGTTDAAVKQHNCSEVGASGTYTYNLTLGTASTGKTVYVKGFIQYTDENGALHTMYTDVVTMSPVNE